MKIGMANKLTIMNRFVLHTLQRNITHLAVITRKTNIKIDILKCGGGGGGSGKEPVNFHKNRTIWSTNLHVKVFRWG